MSVEMILTNARVVTADSEFDGTVVVRDGLIAEVAEGRSHVADAVDLEGDYLVPGLVELHTDNMEKHFAPRPGVKWPSLSAVMAHDTQIAAAGITTVFDSLALGDVRAAVGDFGNQPVAQHHRAVELAIGGDDAGVGQDQLDAHAGTPTDFPESATSWMRVASASRTEASWKMPTIAAPASRR